MADLAEFLLARIAEDEADALAASPGPWSLDADGGDVLAVDGITAAEGFALSNRQQRATAVHIARHDPARVLAECDAKRQIVENVYPDLQRDNDDLSFQTGASADPRDILRFLALPYADHPEYRSEWKP